MHKIACVTASAVMAVVMLAVPITTAVLSGHEGVSAKKAESPDPGDEEPPIPLYEDEELFILGDQGVNRHMPDFHDSDDRRTITGTQTTESPSHTASPGGSAVLPSEKAADEHAVSRVPSDAGSKKDSLTPEESVSEEEMIRRLRQRLEEKKSEAGRIEDEHAETPGKDTAGEMASTTRMTATPRTLPPKNGTFLIHLKYPDKNYVGRPLKVRDRKYLEGLVMGEFGNDYLGAVLVAQCIRDSMVKSGTNSAAVIKRQYGYTARVRSRVSPEVKRAVAFVFDQGGSAVQHPIYYFYASNLVRGRWHESQKFIVQRKAVRFFSPRTR